VDDNRTNLSDYLHMLRQGKWIIVAATTLGVLVGVLAQPAVREPTYETTATLQIHPFVLSTGPDGAGITPVQPGVVPPAELEAARSAAAAARTARELRIEGGAEGLLTRLRVTTQEGTDLIQLRLSGEGADTLQELRTYVDHYVDLRADEDAERIETYQDQLETKLAEIEATLEAIDPNTSPRDAAIFDGQSGLYASYEALRTSVETGAALAGKTVTEIGSPASRRTATLPSGALMLIAAPLAGFLLGSGAVLIRGVRAWRADWRRAVAYAQRERLEGRL
jgi:hypothetical protein